MLVKQLVKESLGWHNLQNVIWIIGLTISDQLQNVSHFPKVVIMLGWVKHDLLG
jgi:hypothetical protein